MPNKATAAIGNQLIDMLLYLPSVPVPNVPANSTAQQLVNVPGVQVGDCIQWNWQGNVANLAIDNVFVSANGVLSFAWANATVGAINGTPNQPFLLELIRTDIQNAFGDVRNALPNAVI